MKTLGRFFSLLGLLLVVLALPGQENRSLTPRIGASAPAPDAPGPPTREPEFGAITTLDGSDTCTAPPSIASLPFNDTGNTNGKNDNSTGFSTPACNDPLSGFQRPGPDVIYSFTIVGFGNSLTFTVTPVAPDADYDTAIYVVGACLQLGSCINGEDILGPGGAETLTVANLLPGTYSFAVDSQVEPLKNPDQAAGNFSLSVTGNLGTRASPRPRRRRSPPRPPSRGRLQR